MQSLIALPLLAVAICAALHFVSLHLFPKIGLLDFPERYGLTRRRLPYPTGILAVLTFLFLFAGFFLDDPQEAGVLLGVLLLGIISFIDDRKKLSPKVRLLTQIFIALLIFATGTRIYTITNPLEGLGLSPFLKLDSFVLNTPFFGALPVLSGVFTIVWLLLTINAMNWFDGIPGQVTALSTIGYLTIGFLSLSQRVNQPDLALLAFILAALAFASLLFDFPPPRVVLGDTGSMFFGLLLGVLTIYAGGKVATGFLVLGVPLIDSFIVVLRRIRKGASLLQGNTTDEHLHHRLLAKGWSATSVILLTSFIGAGFGITALFIGTVGKFIAGLILFLLMILLSWWSRPQ